MPANHRAYLKRYADEALNDLGRAHEKMVHLAGDYGDIHPEYRTACEQIATMITQVAEFLATFRNQYI
jgi:hypothetical protein